MKSIRFFYHQDRINEIESALKNLGLKKELIERREGEPYMVRWSETNFMTVIIIQIEADLFEVYFS